MHWKPYALLLNNSYIREHFYLRANSNYKSWVWVASLLALSDSNEQGFPLLVNTSADTQDVDNPTSPFIILEPENPWIDEFYVVPESRATDFKAPKLWKGSSGSILWLLDGWFDTSLL